MTFYSVQDSEIVFFITMKLGQIVLAAATGFFYGANYFAPDIAFPIWPFLSALLVTFVIEGLLYRIIFNEHRLVEVEHHYPDEPFQ